MGPAWRHMRTDRERRSRPGSSRGTVRRVLGFAAAAPRALIARLPRPHRRRRRRWSWSTRCWCSGIVDDGILAGDTGLVTVLALGDGRGRARRRRARPSLGGWFSSRIGEGLIFDLRTRVFGHVQRQSLAFFTRTQTGALVSRLNNDVIGAQRAFTSTLSSTVSSTISVVVVGIAMFALSWQVTLLCLALFPILLLASRLGQRPAGRADPASRWTATPTWAT